MVRAGALYAPGYEFESRRQHNTFSSRLMAGQVVLVHLIEVRILGGKQKGSRRTRLRHRKTASRWPEPFLRPVAQMVRAPD